MGKRNGTGTPRIHGQSDTPLYNVWLSMRARCTRTSDTNYKYYGARGIKVCDDWQNSFVPFYKWALSNGYKYGLTLDRLDVNGQYEPSNCRWITSAAQKRNMRSNHLVTAFEETKTVADWSEDPRCSVSYNAILYRLKKGWRPEDAIRQKRTQTGGPK